jgi:succinyl-CoA synthetase beta subunit
MNIHEYQAKQILRKHGVRVPEGRLITRAQDAQEAAREIASATGTDRGQLKLRFMQREGKEEALKLPIHLKKQNIMQVPFLECVWLPSDPAGGEMVRKVLVEQGIYYREQNR